MDLSKKFATCILILACIAIAAAVSLSLWDSWSRTKLAHNQTADLATLCHDFPWAGGVIVVLGSWLLFYLCTGEWKHLELTRGADKKPSSSKMQFFLWTFVVLFCYATIFVAKFGVPGLGVKIINIPLNLLLVTGFSVVTAVGAKGITVGYLNNNSINKNQASGSDTGYNQLLLDDSGNIDLTRFQMLAWTLVGIGSYAVKVSQVIRAGAWGSDPNSVDMPDLDQALMVLMGFGHGAYLGKKLIVNTTPTISSVSPSRGRSGTLVTLTGSNFGNSDINNQITFDGLVVSAKIKSWTDGSIQFVFPTAASVPPYDFGKAKSIGVTVSGQESNTVPLTLCLPELQNLSLKDGKAMLVGNGFGGPDGASLSINGNAVAFNLQDWSESSIIVAASVVSANDKTVAVILNVDGKDVTAHTLPIFRG